MSRSDSGDGSALPTTANWAKNPQIQQSRRSSMAASRSTPSPKTTASKFAQQIAEKVSEPPIAAPAVVPTPSPIDAPTEPSEGNLKEEEKTLNNEIPKPAPPAENVEYTRPSLVSLEQAVRTIIESKFEWSLDRSLYDEETLNVIDNYPMLVDPNGGAIRHAQMAQQDRVTLKRDEEEQNILQAISTTTEDDENLPSGSLQLGGEPEPQEGQNDSVTGQRNVFQQRAFNHSFDPASHLANDFSHMSFGGSVLTPAQQQLLLLKSNNQAQDSSADQFRRNTGNTSMHQSQLSNPFVSQNQHLNLFPGHARQASRFNFTNDSTSSSATVKPATSAQLMAQQSAMMPTNQAKAYTHQQQQQQQSSMHTSFYSGVQGPPPGLKSTGTPPISGGGMFGQGHGFAGAMASQNFGNGTLTGKAGDEMRHFFPRRQPGMMGNGLGTDDSGKREFMFPSFLPKPTMPSSTPPAPGLLGSLVGPVPGAFAGYHDPGLSKQKKKGKKHRHANTSSSGGGGIVDLADPSILQARMHHGGAGQGPYNTSQGQGGYASNMMYGGGFGGQRY